MKKFFLFLIVLSVNIQIFALEKGKWISGDMNKPDPISSENAVKGGALRVYSGSSPKSLNYYLDNNTFSANIFGSMYETLLSFDPLTYDYTSNIAEFWKISETDTEFFFRLNPAAKWSDGKQITAADIKFSFETIMNPKNMTGVHKVGLERFYAPEIIDTFTIKFISKEKHWKNLLELSSLIVLPEHYMKNLDFNKINFEFKIVSGPYKLNKINENHSIILERRKDWWQKDFFQNRYTNNFDFIVYRILNDRNDAFELFKKGEIDLFPVYTSSIWINQTNSDVFRNNWIVKQKIVNSKPVGFQGWALNMRSDKLSDINVRKALAHLLNRKLMNEKLMYNQYFMHKSYFEDLYDNNKFICSNELTEFDIVKARELLKKSGWTVNSAGKLEKNGTEFVLEFLMRDKSSEKFVNIFAQDAAKVGITVKLTLVDFAEWAKRMGEFNYEITWASWSAGIFKDPEGMWDSKEADRLEGNNITGYKNTEVDKLIDKLKNISDISERNEICRKIDSLIFNEYPYILLWNINYTRLLYWNRFGTPKTVLSKYGDERSAYSYWWYDYEKAVELEDAMADNEPLPPLKNEIIFSDYIK